MGGYDVLWWVPCRDGGSALQPRVHVSSLYRFTSRHKNCQFRVAEATLSGAWIMGNAFAFSGDFNKALNAAKRVFQLLDRCVDLVDAGELPTLQEA